MNNVYIDNFTSVFEQLRDQVEKLVSVNIKYKKTIDRLKYELNTLRRDTNENYTIIKNITPTDFSNIIDACINVIDKLQENELKIFMTEKVK